MQTAKLGRPVSIAPCQTNCSCRSTVCAVDGRRDPAERLQGQPGRGHDHVGLEHAAALQPDALGHERVDVVGDDVGLAVPDGAEQVGVGYGAEPLVPGVVRRGEVLRHQLPVTAELLRGQAEQQLARTVGEALAEVCRSPA